MVHPRIPHFLYLSFFIKKHTEFNFHIVETKNMLSII